MASVALSLVRYIGFLPDSEVIAAQIGFSFVCS